eukprot:TRINITY_DN6970_c0_g2_i1.p1 TRINITY_DN6970_c0_g2~~TRINITY_DN6970_c0_g2_i1.p1  ORF type:complete len:589 (-),score=171.83 TRINITY_DN6970_c0_g2_i1:157-1923(-)
MTFLDAISFFKLLLLLPYDSPSEQLRAANISDKGIARLPAKLAFLKSLKKLIASKNVMTDLTPLSVLVTLSHLDISSNPALIDLVPLRPLVNLSVINISNCKVSSLRGLEGCRSLSALVANDNRIVISGADGKTGGAAGVANLDVLKVLGATLETIILSRNPSLCGGYKPSIAPTPISDAPGAEVDDDAVSRIQEDPNHPLTVFASTYFPKLKKISISECEITSLPPRWFLPFATEVRLARNRIPYFPSAVIMRSVRILDLSHNLLEHYNSLRRQRYLVQLTIKGNPLSHLKEYQRVRSEKEAEGPTEGASEDALQTVTISPLEVLYIRSTFSDLTHLDGRKLTDPPAPAQKKDIQHAIHALQKKLLPKAAPVVAEAAEEAVVEDVQAAEEEEAEEVIADYGPEPAPEVVKGKQRIKRLASTQEFDPEEDGLMDESLMSRRRRRQEDDGRAEAEAPAPMVVKKRSTDSALKGAKLRKSIVQEGAVVGAKRPRSEVPPPPTADSGSDIDDVAYEIPTAVRAALLDPAKGASNLVKRERALAPPVVATNSHHGNNRNSRHQQQQKPPAPALQGASALAALRASTSQTSGW